MCELSLSHCLMLFLSHPSFVAPGFHTASRVDDVGRATFLQSIYCVYFCDICSWKETRKKLRTISPCTLGWCKIVLSDGCCNLCCIKDYSTCWWHAVRVERVQNLLLLDVASFAFLLFL